MSEESKATLELPEEGLPDTTPVSTEALTAPETKPPSELAAFLEEKLGSKDSLTTKVAIERYITENGGKANVEGLIQVLSADEGDSLSQQEVQTLAREILEFATKKESLALDDESWINEELKVALTALKKKVDDQPLTAADRAFIMDAHKRLKALTKKWKTQKYEGELHIKTYVLRARIETLAAYSKDESRWNWRWSVKETPEEQTKLGIAKIEGLRITRFKKVLEDHVGAEFDEEQWKELQGLLKTDEYYFADSTKNLTEARTRFKRLLKKHGVDQGQIAVISQRYFDRKYNRHRDGVVPKIEPADAAEVEETVSSLLDNTTVERSAIPVPDEPDSGPPAIDDTRRNFLIAKFDLGQYLINQVDEKTVDQFLIALSANENTTSVETAQALAKELLKPSDVHTESAATPDNESPLLPPPKSTVPSIAKATTITAAAARAKKNSQAPLSQPPIPPEPPSETLLDFDEPKPKEKGRFGKWIDGIFGKKTEEPDNLAATVDQNPDFAVVEKSSLSDGKKELLKHLGWGAAGAVTSLALSVAGMDRQQQAVLGMSLSAEGHGLRFFAAVKAGEVMQKSPDGLARQLATSVFEAIGTTIGEKKWLASFLAGYGLANLLPAGEMMSTAVRDFTDLTIAGVSGEPTPVATGSVTVVESKSPEMTPTAQHTETASPTPTLEPTPTNTPTPETATPAPLQTANEGPEQRGIFPWSNPLLDKPESPLLSTDDTPRFDNELPTQPLKEDVAVSSGVSTIGQSKPPDYTVSDTPRFDTEQPEKAMGGGEVGEVYLADVISGKMSPGSNMDSIPTIDAPQLDPGPEDVDMSTMPKPQVPSIAVAETRPAPPIGPELTPPDSVDAVSSRPIPPIEPKVAPLDAADVEVTSSRPTPPIGPELTPPEEDETIGAVAPSVVEFALPQLEQTTLSDQHPWEHFVNTLHEHRPVESGDIANMTDRVDPIKDVFNALNTYAFDEKGYAPDALQKGGSILMLSDGITMEEVRDIVQEKGYPVMFSKDQILRLDQYVTEALLTPVDNRTDLQTFVAERLHADPKFGGEANEIWAKEFATLSYDKLEQLVAIAVTPPEESTPAVLAEQESAPVVSPPAPPVEDSIAEEPIVVTSATDTEKLAADLVADMLKDKSETEQPELKIESSKPAPEPSELTPNEDDASVPAPEPEEEQQPEVSALETIVTEEAYGDNFADVQTVLEKAGWEENSSDPGNLAWRANRIDALLDSIDTRVREGDSEVEKLSPARRMLYEIVHSDVSPESNVDAQALLDLVLSEVDGDFTTSEGVDGIFGSLNRNLGLASQDGLLAYTSFLLEGNDFKNLEGTLSYWLDPNLPEEKKSDIVGWFGYVATGDDAHRELDEVWFSSFKTAVAEYYAAGKDPALAAKVQDLFSQLTAFDERPIKSAKYFNNLLK